MLLNQKREVCKDEFHLPIELVYHQKTWKELNMVFLHRNHSNNLKVVLYSVKLQFLVHRGLFLVLCVKMINLKDNLLLYQGQERKKTISLKENTNKHNLNYSKPEHNYSKPIIKSILLKNVWRSNKTANKV